MSTLFIVPIEPLEERYTESWYRNFPIQFREMKAFKNVEVIDGEALTNHVEVGTFLDINSTVHYKNSQMMAISKLFHERKVKSGDVFYFLDVEFWGIESVRIMARMNKVEIIIAGFLHAGSYTKEDAFAIASDFQKYTELGWVSACDLIFVGTNYSGSAFIDRRIKPLAANAEECAKLSKKIVVTGNPIFIEDYPLAFKVPDASKASNVISTYAEGDEDEPQPRRTFSQIINSQAKRKKLVITNRFDYEKRPNLSLDFALIMKHRHPDLEIVVTTSRPKFTSNKAWLVEYARALEAQGVITIKEGLTKAEYHAELASASVMLSNTMEENFGYCVVEAMLHGCAPLVPKAFSHPEVLESEFCTGEEFMFECEDEIIPKIEKLLNQGYSVKDLQDGVRKYVSSKVIRSTGPLCTMADHFKRADRKLRYLR